MSDFEARILHDPPLASLQDYLDRRGGQGLAGARAIGPEETMAEIAAAGLRGRGGAGFPTATKWRSVVAAGGGQRFAVCNGAEGEPGTFKDRTLLRANPYAVIEGLLIAAETVGAVQAYLAVKASFARELERLRAALAEVEEAGWLGGVTINLITGPEEYLFGEEKALLEVIEGNEPLPRWLPPYMHGLFATAPQLGWQSHAGESGEQVSNPTLVNNAETLAHVAWIMANGVDAFRAAGTADSAGSLLCTAVGDVQRATVVELPMGTPLSALIEAAGGFDDGRTFKAAFSGVANPVVTAEHLDAPLSYEGMVAAGSGLGAGGFIVYDDSACMVEVAATMSRFLWVESCGQCPPCKLGTGDITAALERIRTGDGTDADIGRIGERLRVVADGNRCYLPVQERELIASVLRSFPEDFAAHLEGRCPSHREFVPIPKLVDITHGVAVYDSHQAHKRPDWTYDKP